MDRLAELGYFTFSNATDAADSALDATSWGLIGVSAAMIPLNLAVAYHLAMAVHSTCALHVNSRRLAYNLMITFALVALAHLSVLASVQPNSN